MMFWEICEVFTRRAVVFFREAKQVLQDVDFKDWNSDSLTSTRNKHGY